MANTYTQIYIHYVFAVQNRKSLISPKWENELYKYITGIVQKYEHKLLIVNGVQDHLHILVRMSPKQSSSDLMYNVKRSSSMWINDNKLVQHKFNWQEGFGGFSVSNNEVASKIKYIENQKSHHKKSTFKEEYKQFLKENNIDYEEKYIFKDPE